MAAAGAPTAAPFFCIRSHASHAVAIFQLVACLGGAMELSSPDGGAQGVDAESVWSRKPFNMSESMFGPASTLLMGVLSAFIGMWACSSYFMKRDEWAVAEMQQLRTADLVLRKMLLNFDIKSVDEYKFHGIVKKSVTVSVGFENLGAVIGKSKTILAGVTGRFDAYRMAAIMGPSGAGKTTFLNALSGKTKAQKDWEVTGKVLVNGDVCDITKLKNVTGFVPQDDVVHEGMTVRENITFSAQLRNTRGTSRHRIKRIVQDVLMVLQLEAQQNIIVGNRTTCGGLSGGQRKRVNVGIELASCPTLLFLDEPTSGLDATSSLVLVRQLKKMTELGMTIALVIHQPRYSLFTLFDDVLLLGQGGRTVFMGPSTTAKPYFQKLDFSMPENENPADWMMDVISGQLDIPHPTIPPEDVSAQLIRCWDQHASPVYSGEMPPPEADSQDLSTRHKKEVIERHVRDEWRKISPDDEPMDMDQFKTLLVHCTGQRPDTEVLNDLMARVCSASTQIFSVEVRDNVTQRQLINCLLSFSGSDSPLCDLESGCYDATAEELTEEEEEDDDDEYDEVSEMDSGDGATCETCHRFPVGLRRRLPGCCEMFRIELHRRILLWWRGQKTRMAFFAIVIFAGLFLAIADRYIFDSPDWDPTTFLNSHIAVALLVSVHSLRLFGEDQPVFWRESSHGLNKLAFFAGRTLVDVLDWSMMCQFMACAYYIIAQPRIPLGPYIVAFLMVGYVGSGLGYFLSCALPPSLGPFLSSLLSFVLGGILGLPNQIGTFLANPLMNGVVSSLSFTRWSVQMSFLERIYEGKKVERDQLGHLQGALFGLYEDNYSRVNFTVDGFLLPTLTGVVALTIQGTVLRCLAYVALLLVNRDKQV